MVKKLLYGTLLSVLIFFTISFLTVLQCINSPLHRQHNDHLKIGFPLTYYHQFMADYRFGIPNSGWEGQVLVLDIFLTWIVTIFVYLFAARATRPKN